MDYDKIGMFILERRKELNMTQKELATKLNITDSAVSRWEQGKGCPDVSILEPLANILGNSVLEIIRGEEIKENKDKFILDVLKKEEKRIKRSKVIVLVFINLLFIGLLFMFFTLILSLFLSNNPDYTSHMIISASMEPSYSNYDVVLFKKSKLEDLKVGDVILFDYEPKNYYHVVRRVIQIEKIDTSRGLILHTKGDNNKDEDNIPISEDNLIGKEVVRFPKMGRVIRHLEFDSILDFTLVFVSVILGIAGIIGLDVLIIKDFKQVGIRKKNKERNVI